MPLFEDLITLENQVSAASAPTNLLQMKIFASQVYYFVYLCGMWKGSCLRLRCGKHCRLNVSWYIPLDSGSDLRHVLPYIIPHA